MLENDLYFVRAQHFLFSPSFLLQDKKEQINTIQERVKQIEDSL